MRLSPLQGDPQPGLVHLQQPIRQTRIPRLLEPPFARDHPSRQPQAAARTAATPADQAPITAPPAPAATAGGPPAEIRIEPPPPNAVRVVPIPAGALVVLDAPFFHPDVARYVVDGEDLVVVLQNGAIVRLDGFFGHPEMPPSLSVVGGPAQTASGLGRGCSHP